MNTYKKLLLAGLLFCSTAVYAEEKKLVTERKIADQNIPANLLALTDDDTKVKLSLDNGIGYNLEPNVDLDGKGQKSYIVVLYKAVQGEGHISCELLAFKVFNGTSTPSKATVKSTRQSMGNCDELIIKDLNGDGKPEAIVTTSGMRGQDTAPFIFKWDGGKFVEITPLTNFESKTVNAFRVVHVSDTKIGKKLLLIDYPFADLPSDPHTLIYTMENGQITQTGSYDFFTLIEKKPHKPVSVTTLNPSFPEEGSYTLTIKNVSDHKRTVRAEVIVNGSVVLKSQDFCQSPPSKNRDKDHDDDDDMDEDRCKRCIQKQDTYAIVNLKSANQIKVKLYGRGDSKIQLTLNKK